MKAMDTTAPTPDKFEVCTLQRCGTRACARAHAARALSLNVPVRRSVDGVVVQRVLPDADVAAAIARVVAAAATSGDA